MSLLRMALLVLLCGSLAATAQQGPEIYAHRRAALMEMMGPDSVAVFRAAPVAPRNGDVSHPYRQASDFYYLTGFEEPGSAFLLLPGAKDPFVMFVTPRNPAKEIWDGYRLGTEGAIATLKADKAYSIDQFDDYLRDALQNRKRVFYGYSDPGFNIQFSKALNGFPRGWHEVVNPQPYLHTRRLIKDASEIELLQKAIDITCQAQIAAMKAARPNVWEYELEAAIEGTFRRLGAQRLGFESIVGSGPNSTTLHYLANQRQTQPGEVVVMDIGAEYGYYTADVTRTIPAGGTFSDAQKEIYNLVLEAQEAAIQHIRPGVTFQSVHNKALAVLKKGLHQLGLITDPGSKWQYGVYFMHRTSHWLGMDVHDVGGYNDESGASRVLKPGMVLTVEPGVYVRADALTYLPQSLNPYRLGLSSHSEISEAELAAFIKAVAPAVEKYRNIGVRIEDDILVTEDGYRNMSLAAPRAVDEIEALVKQGAQ